MGKSALEANIVKGLGTAGKAMGKLIGSIPIVKDGSVDEFLLDKGDNLQKNAKGMEQKAVKTFETIGDPGTNVFVEKWRILFKFIIIQNKFVLITKKFTC